MQFDWQVARTILLYAMALALGAAALQWIDIAIPRACILVRNLPCAGRRRISRPGRLGAERLTPRPAPVILEVNQAAIRSLGLTPREHEILEQLASGQSNKELARELAISPNTVKTHVARLYEKLEVRNRIEAIEKARWLALSPVLNGR